jgi:membrane associated rhomboid family serine protease
MIPVSDSVQTRRFPFVNITIILACIAVFIYELTLSAAALDDFFRDYAIVPGQLSDWTREPSGWEEPATVITAAFLHGGWLHLAGNLIFLWVFGDNVEDALGHVPYVVFYALCAAGAAALQVATDTSALIPVLGASGAIAGVLGAYLVLYPRAAVIVVIPFLFFLPLPVPAFLLIGMWFILQLFAGVATIGSGQVSEVAVWAHVGGFLTGLALMLLLRPFIPKRPLSRRPAGGLKRMF